MKSKIAICLFLLISSGLSAVQQQEGDSEFLINDNNVNVRSEPNVNSKVIAKMNFGSEVFGEIANRTTQKINGTENFWYKIRLDDKNNFGYIWGEYLSRILFYFKIENKSLLFVTNKLFFGKFDNFEYGIENLSVYFGGKFTQLKISESKQKRFQYCTVFRKGNNEYLFMTEWFFRDAEVFQTLYELFDLDVDNLKLNQIAFNGE